ncbi:MAG: hypothetical protein Q4G16_11395 [Cruoricaptor ignavus]|nr:hypothetical protein [Cruoricaptor ignavus]
MFLALILVGFGVFLILKTFYTLFFKKPKPVIKPSEGEILENKYIINHEKKLKNDAEYYEYLDWCKLKRKSPVDKECFDEYEMKEYQMYKKLRKHGIKGLR